MTDNPDKDLESLRALTKDMAQALVECRAVLATALRDTPEELEKLERNRVINRKIGKATVVLQQYKGMMR